MEPNCLKCRMLVIAEYGYSDYTVEDTQISCIRERFDNREYVGDYESKEAKDEQIGLLEKAATDCPYFWEGEPLEMNVEYDNDEDNEETRLLLSKARNP